MAAARAILVLILIAATPALTIAAESDPATDTRIYRAWIAYTESLPPAAAAGFRYGF